MIDLTPKTRPISAEQELVTPYIPGERPLGETIGGLQMFSNVFKRGYGEKVFGSDENGIWLGGSDYDKGKFKVNMSGEAEMKSVTLVDENDQTFIDAKGIVSTANFKYGSATYTTYQEVDGSTSGYKDVSNPQLTISLSRSARVLCMASVWAWHNTSGQQATLRMYVGEGRRPLALVTDTIHTLPLFGVYELSAGDHTFKLQVENLTPVSGEKIAFGDISIIYMILGN